MAQNDQIIRHKPVFFAVGAGLVFSVLSGCAIHYDPATKRYVTDSEWKRQLASAAKAATASHDPAGDCEREKYDKCILGLDWGTKFEPEVKGFMEERVCKNTDFIADWSKLITHKEYGRLDFQTACQIPRFRSGIVSDPTGVCAVSADHRYCYIGGSYIPQNLEGESPSIYNALFLTGQTPKLVSP